MRVISKLLIFSFAISIANMAKSQAIISFRRDPSALHIYNAFTSELTALGLSRTVNEGSSIFLNSDSTLVFELMGTAGGYVDTLEVAGLPPYTETTIFDQNNFTRPVRIGSAQFLAGTLTGQIVFTNPVGRTVTVGDEGFGVYLPDGLESGGEVSSFYLGYDDESVDLADSDYDDFLVRATVSTAGSVPEPATWATMMLGFLIIGLLAQRRVLKEHCF